MSYLVTGWVRQHSPAQYGNRLVLLELADRANDDGTGAYPSVARLAADTRLSERQVQRALGELKATEQIAEDGKGPKGTTRWRVVMEVRREASQLGLGEGGDNLSGVSSATQNGDKMSPEPSLRTVHRSREERERALEEGQPLRLKFRGKLVPEPEARKTCLVHRHFCERAGLSLQRFTPSGEPSESLKRVLGAVTANPEVPFEQWARTVDGVLESPWWEGSPSIGVVFGPKVVEENLANPSRARGRAQTRQSAAERERQRRDERIKARLERAEGAPA